METVKSITKELL